MQRLSATAAQSGADSMFFDSRGYRANDPYSGHLRAGQIVVVSAQGNRDRNKFSFNFVERKISYLLERNLKKSDFYKTSLCKDAFEP